MSGEAEKEQPKWKRCERLAYEIQKELAGNTTVALNDSIVQTYRTEIGLKLADEPKLRPKKALSAG
jgi:hypothetical protein